MELREIPWITDGANDFLKKVIESGEVKTVLEFGSGASTYWMAKQGVKLISVEHDKGWHDFLSTKFKEENLDVDYIFAQRPYNGVATKYHNENIKFDMVIDDGRDRVKCAESAHGLVRKGGYFMLDNDERPKYKQVHNILKDWGNKQIFEQDGPDYTGWIKWKTHHDTRRWITTVWQRPE